MALGENTSKNQIFIALKQKAGASEKETPRFAIAEKDASGTWVETKSYGFVEGQINKAYIEEKDFKKNGKIDRMFVLEMEDNGEQYKVTMPHGGLTYLILNSLASGPNSLDKFKISVDKKQDGKYWNARGFVNVNGNRDGLKWHTDMKATPRPEPVMVNGVHLEVNGEKAYDRTALKKFWEEFFVTHIVSKLTGGNVSSVKPAVTNNTAAATNTNAPVNNIPEEDDFQDLPF